MTTPCTRAPNTQSDAQWLHDMGYLNGIQDFMTDYGFTHDEQDRRDALNLIRQFRNEHQAAWEKLHHQTPHALRNRKSQLAHEKRRPAFWHGDPSCQEPPPPPEEPSSRAREAAVRGDSRSPRKNFRRKTA
ncbi:hypothetical protein MFRU_003g02830 [Monilinia fructicola]|nr:hypothetical protein MFRU_003g02830 [Monilinia fructicola]